jgi:hypothetical protein
MLSFIAYQFDAVVCARVYAAEARAIPLALSGQWLTYRPPRPSKFLRLGCNLRGERESLLLSVIGGILVVPPIRVTRIGPDQILTAGTIDIVEFDIEQFKLRLRLRRLAKSVESLERMTSPEDSGLVVHSIIIDNLRYSIASTQPLDRAIDFFSLARDFAGKGNFPLAALSLEKAEAALNAPTTEITTMCPREVQAVKEQIARTIHELRRSAV